MQWLVWWPSRSVATVARASEGTDRLGLQRQPVSNEVHMIRSSSFIIVGIAAACAVICLSIPASAQAPTTNQFDPAFAKQLVEKMRGGQALSDSEKAYLRKARDAGVLQQALPAPPRLSAGGTNGIDWRYAQQLMQKLRNGQPLSPVESSYMERAKQARDRGEFPPAATGTNAAPAPKATTGMIPLDQMTAEDRYKSEDGGLYGEGRNEPPAAFQKAAERELARIEPLDRDGKPSKEGKVVLLSIGMSNTTQEFWRFKELAEKDPDKAPWVAIVDGAQGGQDAAGWIGKESRTWEVAENRIRGQGFSPLQVQAIWLKQALKGPAALGEFPKHAERLRDDLIGILNGARKRYPNLRIAYLSSRIYGGYASSPLNPEPYAYESVYAVRWVIRAQMQDDPRLNMDEAKGEVRAPLLLWGPYLWADGTTPRKSDGLTWVRDDLGPDGTHPSPDMGRDKVGRLLLQFFKTSPYAGRWFLTPPPGVSPAKPSAAAP